MRRSGAKFVRQAVVGVVTACAFSVGYLGAPPWAIFVTCVAAVGAAYAVGVVQGMEIEGRRSARLEAALEDVLSDFALDGGRRAASEAVRESAGGGR